MKRISIAAGLAVFALAPVAKTQQPTPKFIAEVPLLDCEGTPCIEATLGATQKVKLAVDTGNAYSVIDTKVAAAAGIHPSASAPANPVSGMFRATIPELRIGALTFSNLTGQGMNLAEFVEHGEMPRVDGALAYTAFHDRVLELDFADKKLRISEPLSAATSCDGACGKISLITFGKNGPPIVVAEGFELDGKKLTAQVDTMYTGSLLVYTDSIAKLGLSAAAATKETERFAFTDGGVEMRVAPAAAESFRGTKLGGSGAKIYFPTPGVHEPDGLFDATVGLALFRDTVLTLDFHNMTISVRKPRNS